jgi:phosphatidylserine/phosphatidylglycerophosphate/cardiolipin synthase-like enzyme
MRGQAEASAVLGHPILSSDFEAEMDRLTGTFVQEGNYVELLPSGVSSYVRRWELLEKAQRSIHIVAFSMMRDGTSRKLTEIICRKARAGVACRLIFDDGVLYSTFAGSLLRAMVSAGAEVIRYNFVFRNVLPQLEGPSPVGRFVRICKGKLRRRFHEKYMIVDGTEAILGGINWGDKYAYGGKRPKAWRDSDVYMSGPVVGAVQRQFVRDLFVYRAMQQESLHGRASSTERAAALRRAIGEESRFIAAGRAELFPLSTSTGGERIRYVPHKPYDEGRLRLTHAHLLLLREAKQYVRWGCHGIRPPTVLAEALVNAARRGVDVRLITNSKKAARTLMLRGLLGWMYRESSRHYRYLIENGVRVYEWQRPGAFHSKNLVIDDVVASIGSFNVASGSMFHHTESNVIVFGGEFPRRVREQFETDFKDCSEVSLEAAPRPKASADPYLRLLHPRNLLIDDALLPASVRCALNDGLVKDNEYEEDPLCPSVEFWRPEP